MTRRIGVHLVAPVLVEVTRLEQPGPEADGQLVGGTGILHMKVQVYLLGGTVGPLGHNVVRCELDTDRPIARGGDDAAELLVAEDLATEHSGPERALGLHVSGVEHDDPTHEFHAPNVASVPYAGG